MPKHALSFIELHNPLFMEGVNLGTKIKHNTPGRAMKLLQDDERGVVWVFFKGKFSFVPLSNVASADTIEVPEEIRRILAPEPVATEPTAGPAAIMRRRGRPPGQQPEQAETPSIPTFDPNDTASADAHRAAVRAASANANRAQPLAQQNDALIQESRAAAMGIKHHKTAQVQTAQQVGETAALKGKTKAISHAQLRAQIKAEEKTTL